MAVVGTASLFITTSSVDIAQTPFVMVHLNVFAPTPKPVSPDVGVDGVVIVPVPVIKVHAPVPINGVFPARDVLSRQIVWSEPALAVVGTASSEIRIDELIEILVHPPFENTVLL